MHIGPTGEYHGAKINASDQGGINIGLAIKNGEIVMLFGTSLDWLAGGPEHMLPVGIRLGQLALKLSNGQIDFNKLSLGVYNAAQEPLPQNIEVKINREKNLIETRLPVSVEGLVFDAQGAFAYGLRLLVCVKALRPNMVPFLKEVPEEELKHLE